ncbi:YiiD C-terminal domain-containing protein [Zooshikella sp. RANM57]|uniref:YiiD C-terminal domain-containing protein n=1 Tax=Zooshikella sp. RANM57 TaxID=3425863 RepID=UPI003D6FE4E4
MKLAIAQELDAYLQANIPLIAAMQIKVSYFDGKCLRLSAPLAVNINDKQTAFGGSIATLATITGWAMATLLAKQASGPNQVVIAESKLRYLKPITDDFFAECLRPVDSDLDSFCHDLNVKSTAKLVLPVQIKQGNKITADFTGTYVASVNAPPTSAACPMIFNE